MREKNEAEEKLNKLSIENKKLLASSKSWMPKYLDLSPNHKSEPENEYFWTPKNPSNYFQPNYLLILRVAGLTGEESSSELLTEVVPTV